MKPSFQYAKLPRFQYQTYQPHYQTFSPSYQAFDRQTFKFSLYPVNNDENDEDPSLTTDNNIQDTNYPGDGGKPADVEAAGRFYSGLFFFFTFTL